MESTKKLEQNELLINEASKNDKVILEILSAILAREEIIERFANDGVTTVSEIKASGYFEVADDIHILKQKHRVELL